MKKLLIILICFFLFHSIAYAYGDKIPISFKQSDYVLIGEFTVPHKGKIYWKKGTTKKLKRGIRSEWMELFHGIGNDGDTNSMFGYKGAYTVNCKDGIYSVTTISSTNRGFWKPGNDTFAPLEMWQVPQENSASGIVFDYVCRELK